MGVVTLNLPMIWMKAKRTGSDFWETLTEYMEIARGIHKKTAEYLYKMKASSNPLAFMQGGFDGGTLEAHESVEPVLRKSTLSFGYGGLHEITMLQCKKGLSEDTDFAKTVLKYINAEIQRFKAEDKLLYALYGTPGESWLSLACDQFIKAFGKTKGVTDKGFFTNSFHCCVSDDLGPIDKIEVESGFFPLSTGGCICHVKIPRITEEQDPGIKSILGYSMSLGMYQSINHAQNRCLDCGKHWVGDDSTEYEENYTCPDCGSMNTIGIRRMNGSSPLSEMVK